MDATLLPATWQFLLDCEENNNRAWFAANKDAYLAATANAHAFIDALLRAMAEHDHLENSSGKETLYRFHSDLRFDRDKPPYNPRFAFSLRRATARRRGGYYMHIKPGNTYLACGFFGPNKADLQRIREDIMANLEEWRELLCNQQLVMQLGELKGDKVATAPRGFAKDAPGIDLVRHKAFYFRRDFEDEEVLAPGFVERVDAIFQAVRPWFDYMSEVLTTNMNGERIV